MPNNYLNLVNEIASEKFYLVTLGGGRDISSYLILLSGNTYYYDSPFVEVTEITVDGVNYTQTTSNTPSIGQFYFNFLTKQIKINFGTAIGSKIIIADYQFYFSSGLAVETYQDPKNLTGEIVVFEPKIANDSTFTFSQVDVYQGVLSSTTTNISIINTDNYFQQFLSTNDSFYKRPIVFYHCINSVDNIKTVFRGQITDVSYDNTQINFNVIDKLQRLDDLYFSGGSPENDYARTANYPDLLAEKENAPIPKLWGYVSPYVLSTNNENAILDRTAASGVEAVSQLNYILDEGLEGINIDATGFTTTSNRKWVLYKDNGESSMLSVITNAGIMTLGRLTITIDSAGTDKLKVGDMTFIQGSSVDNSHGIVMAKTGSNQYVIQTSRTFASGGTVYPANYIIGSTLVRPEVSQVQLIASDRQHPDFTSPYIYNLALGKDYTVSTNGFGDRVLTLINNFEGLNGWVQPVGVAGTGPLPTDPIKSDYTMRFVLWNGTISYNHSDQIKEIVEASGLTADTTSFNASASTLLDFNFTVPFFGKDFVSYREVLQVLLLSSFGSLSYDYDSDEIKYQLIDNASAGTSIDDNQIILDSREYAVSYRDVVSSISVFNIHNPVSNVTYETGLPYGVALTFKDNFREIENEYSFRNQYLHKINILKRLETVISKGHQSDITYIANYITRISQFIFTAFRTVSLQLKSNFDLELFDDVTLNGDKNFESSPLNLKVVEKSLTSKNINITLTD